jgi:uncharacterized protein (DUF2336 family)
VEYASVAGPAAPYVADPGLVKRALAFMRSQPAEERAEVISALARAYLHSSMSDALHADAILAMTTALDDPSVLVRRALAEALASAANPPRHILLALTADCSEIARAVALSPALDDAALADAARSGDAAVQTAIARRARLGPRASFALADVGQRPAAIALAGNRSIALAPEAQRRLFERFASDAELRNALLARENLQPALRVDIAAANAEDETLRHGKSQPEDSGRAERLAREGRDEAIVAIAHAAPRDELSGLVKHLRKSSYLTPALLLRSLVSGERALFEATLAEMSGAAPRRAAGFARNWRGQGFAALYRKCALPETLLPAFRAALGALDQGFAPVEGGGVSYALTLSVIEACEQHRDPRLAPVIAMLWRLAGESAREEARQIAADVADEPPLPAPVIAESEVFDELTPAPVDEESEEIEAVEAPAPVFDFEAVEEAPTSILDGEAGEASTPLFDFETGEASASGYDFEAVEAPSEVTTDSALDSETPHDLGAQPASAPEEPRLDPAWLELLDELEKPDLDPSGSLPPPLAFTGANENLARQGDPGDAGDLAEAA